MERIKNIIGKLADKLRIWLSSILPDLRFEKRIWVQIVWFPMTIMVLLATIMVIIITIITLPIVLLFSLKPKVNPFIWKHRFDGWK
jgi:hypothetical protein